MRSLDGLVSCYLLAFVTDVDIFFSYLGLMFQDQSPKSLRQSSQGEVGAIQIPLVG